MIRVKNFSNAGELELFIREKNIKRTDIIDIKWTATSHYVYGLLIYENNEVSNPDYYQKNI